jgi:hypothetical protein
MSRFILAILLASFATPVTVVADDEAALVETVKSEIPQTLDPPTPQPLPKSEVKASAKTSGAKKKPKKSSPVNPSDEK